MAKMGEGDPRWIVAERKDGANVNSWHWEEKALNERVHDALKKIFAGLQLCSGEDNLDIKIKELAEISGDVTVAQRKGKIMCYFELKMQLKYAGTDTATQDDVSGKCDIPDVDHDSFQDDFTISVAATGSGKAMDRAQQFVYNKGRAIIRKTIREYFEALYVEFSVGKKVGGPTPAGSPATPGSATTTGSSSNTGAAPAPAKKTSNPVPQGPPDHEATSFEQTFIWRCPASELWAVLTDAGRASAYTRAPAKIEPRPSGTFEFMGGAMSGYYVELAHPTSMVMQWRLSSWPSNVHSSVVIKFSQEEVGVTKMNFAQAGIPAGEMERVRKGWMCNFWDPIKMIFGFQYELK